MKKGTGNTNRTLSDLQAGTPPTATPAGLGKWVSAPPATASALPVGKRGTGFASSPLLFPPSSRTPPRRSQVFTPLSGRVRRGPTPPLRRLTRLSDKAQSGRRAPPATPTGEAAAPPTRFPTGSGLPLAWPRLHALPSARDSERCRTPRVLAASFPPESSFPSSRPSTPHPTPTHRLRARCACAKLPSRPSFPALPSLRPSRAPPSFLSSMSLSAPGWEPLG